MKTLLSLFILSTLTSCASYVNKIHRQIDREENKQNISNRRVQDPYSIYRENTLRSREDKRPISNPQSFSSRSNIAPSMNRQYQNSQYANKTRIKAHHLVDNDNSSSLWANSGQHEGLFTNDDKKRVGDIVVIQVLERLKNDISNELKRVFPQPQTKPKEGEAESTQANAQPAAGNDEVNLQTEGAGAKVYDKISTQIVEEINDQYLLIRGKKEVIFRNQKHLLEVQALISRNDFYDTDKVESDKILESRIFVIK